MNYLKIKDLITKQFDEKDIFQYTAMYEINFNTMVPKKLHDPEIDKFGKIDFDYNFVDLSAYYGSLKAFDFFIKKVQKSIISQSSQNYPLIFYALKGKNDEIIEKVCQKEKEEYFKLYDAIFFSLKIGNIQYLNKFFEEAKKRNPNTDPETLLYDIFQSTNQKSQSPLKLAIKSRSLLCVGFVLNISQKEIPFLIETKQNKHGKPRRRNALTPLHVAARYGCGDISYVLISLDPRMLMKKGPNKYFYPFIDAIKYNISPTNYDEFFKHGKKDKIINLVDSEGNSALHYAVKRGNINAINILLEEKKIDVNLPGEEKKRPIHFAAQTCSLEILQRLLDYPGINLEEKDEYENLAIHDAAESNWAEGFLLLLTEMAKRKKEKNRSIQNQEENSQKNEDDPQNEYSISRSLNIVLPRLPNFTTSADLLGPKSIPQNTNQNQDDISAFTSEFPSRTTSSINYFSTSSEPSTEIHSYQETQLESSIKQSESSTDAFTNTNEENDPNSILSNQFTTETEKEDLIMYIEDIIYKKNRMGLCCFHIAALKNCGNIFDCLEMKFPNIAQRIYEFPSGLTGFTVLHYLAMCGHSKLLDKILNMHPSINVDVQGIDPIVSPLYLASKLNHEKCVKVLKIKGALAEKMTKRHRDKKSYIHTEFMNTLLYSDEKAVKNIHLDITDTFTNPDSGFPILYEGSSSDNEQEISN